MKPPAAAGRIALAITGASGAAYGLRLAEWLVRAGRPLYVMASDHGRLVLREEEGIVLPRGREQEVLRRRLGDARGRLAWLNADDLLAPPSSGTSLCRALVVLPCSMGTLGRIAAGVSSNLIERTADVMLKEGRPLILVPRETPLNSIHLENMLRLVRAGACLLPAMPGFYHRPKRVGDLVDFVVGKVLDALGLEHALYRRWPGDRG